MTAETDDETGVASNEAVVLFDGSVLSVTGSLPFCYPETPAGDSVAEALILPDVADYRDVLFVVTDTEAEFRKRRSFVPTFFIEAAEQ